MPQIEVRPYDAADRDELVATTLERFGRVDVCVNNAGVSAGGADRQATVEALRQVLRVNVEAVFALSQAVAVANVNKPPVESAGLGELVEDNDLDMSAFEPVGDIDDVYGAAAQV